MVFDLRLLGANVGSQLYPTSEGLWHPIETAPKDGTVILLTDGQRFAAAARAFRIEEDWKCLGYDEGYRYPDGSLKIGPRFTERVPNPDAGKRHEWWDMFGCSGFTSDVRVSDDDGPLGFEPTHWMAMPSPPITVR